MEKLDFIAQYIGVAGFLLSLWLAIRTWRHRRSATVLFVPFDSVDSLANLGMDSLKEYGTLGRPDFAGYVMNAGDGEAYMFDVDACGYVAFLYELTEVDGRRAAIGMQSIPQLTREPLKQFLIIWSYPQPPKNAYVGAHWTEEPTRLRRCRFQKLQLQRQSIWAVHRKSKSRIHRIAQNLSNRRRHHAYHHPTGN